MKLLAIFCKNFRGYGRMDFEYGSLSFYIRRKLRIWSHLLTADLITFTEEILNGKLIFCAVMRQSIQVQEWTK